MIWLETGLTSFSLNLADFLISSPSLCSELLILVLLSRNSEEFDTNSLSQVDLAIWSFFLNTFKVSLMCYIVRFFFIKIRVFLFVFENDWSAKKVCFSCGLHSIYVTSHLRIIDSLNRLLIYSLKPLFRVYLICVLPLPMW